MTETPQIHSLATLKSGMKGHVVAVLDESQALGEESEATVARRLIELGFVPGEPLEIIAVVRPGGDPIAVRVGGTCFALRRSEAAAVRVQLDPTS